MSSPRHTRDLETFLPLPILKLSHGNHVTKYHTLALRSRMRDAVPACRSSGRIRPRLGGAVVAAADDDRAIVVVVMVLTFSRSGKEEGAVAALFSSGIGPFEGNTTSSASASARSVKVSMAMIYMMRRRPRAPTRKGRSWEG